MKSLRCMLMFVALGSLAIPGVASGQALPSSPAIDLRAEASPLISRSLFEAPALGEAPEPTPPAPQSRARNQRGVPLMVAGGVLLVAGAIAGGDAGTLLIVGGAGVGAWGAYVYFGG